MSEHHVSVEVQAPVQQVYTLFTHFNDFPKFMSFIREVTYYDDQRSHWVAQVGGKQEWDAVNEDWVPGQQVGWRSVNGVQNSGRVKFTPMGTQRTNVDVYINYVPPAGMLGEAFDKLGFESVFDNKLQEDLTRFAAMVQAAPPGALDPMQSNYLFHEESAYSTATTTERQQEAMAHDPMMHPSALQQRDEHLQQQSDAAMQQEQQQRAEQERVEQEQQRAIEQQRTLLTRQAELDRERARQGQEASTEIAAPTEPHPVYDTLGGRNASIARTAFGDQDARSERFPGHIEDPMTARIPRQSEQGTTSTPVAETSNDSPWFNVIRGGGSEQVLDDNSGTAPEPESTTPPRSNP